MRTLWPGARSTSHFSARELRRLGIVQKNGRPTPTIQGKVERFQQTMKKWLRVQLAEPTTLAQL